MPNNEVLEELKKQYGENIKLGRITLSRGAYTLTVGGRKYALDPDEMCGTPPRPKFTGKAAVAGVIITDGRPSVIAIVQEKPFRVKGPILCYVPAPDFRKKMEAAARLQLVTHLVEEGAISDIMARQISKSIG